MYPTTYGQKNNPNCEKLTYKNQLNVKLKIYPSLTKKNTFK